MTTTTLALQEGFLGDLGTGVGAILAYAVLGAALMIVGFLAIDLTTPGKLTVFVREGRPNAVVVTAAGLVSMSFIVVMAIYGSGGVLLEGLIATAVYGLLGIIAQVVAVRGLEAVIRIDIGAVLADTTPRYAGRVVAAAHVAVGLVVAAAVL